MTKIQRAELSLENWRTAYSKLAEAARNALPFVVYGSMLQFGASNEPTVTREQAAAALRKHVTHWAAKEKGDL
jgi:hypothetical protein